MITNKPELKAQTKRDAVEVANKHVQGPYKNGRNWAFKTWNAEKDMWAVHDNCSSKNQASKRASNAKAKRAALAFARGHEEYDCSDVKIHDLSLYGVEHLSSTQTKMNHLLHQQL